MPKLLAIVTFVALLLGSVRFQAVFAQTAPERASAEAAIRQAGTDYIAAIEKGDPRAIAAFWTADGTYTDEAGHAFKSRELIEKSFADNRAERPQVQLTAVQIRFVTPDVAIQEGTCRVTRDSGTTLPGCFMAVWVNRNNRWQLASLR